MAGASILIPSRADIIQVSDLKKGRTSMEHEQEQQNGLALAEGMERAAAAGERLEFC